MLTLITGFPDRLTLTRKIADRQTFTIMFSDIQTLTAKVSRQTLTIKFAED